MKSIRNDPDYNNGNYVTQPRLMKIASVFFGIATAGGTLNYQSLAPTREKADELVDMRLGGSDKHRRERFPLAVGFVSRLRCLSRP